MLQKLNRFLDIIADFIAHRKGLIPILAIILVFTNFLLQIFPISGWLATSDFLLHLGVILAILGFLFAWAL